LARIAAAQQAAVTPDRVAAIRNRDQAALDRLAANKVIVEPRANTATALMVLALFYSWIPALISLIAWPFMWSYSLTEARQRELRAAIAARAKPAPA
jgi:Na+/melibiose symporter-like transporter